MSAGALTPRTAADLRRGREGDGEIAAAVAVGRAGAAPGRTAPAPRCASGRGRRPVRRWPPRSCRSRRGCSSAEPGPTAGRTSTCPAPCRPAPPRWSGRRRSWSAPARPACSRRSAAGSRRDAVPMPPFQPKQRVPVPAPTEPSSTGPAACALIASTTCSRSHVQAANVVQAAVVGLADQRVDRPHLLVAGLSERVATTAPRSPRRRSACWSGRSASRSCPARPPGSSRRACRTRCRRRRRRPPCPGTGCRRAGRMAVTPGAHRVAFDERDVADRARRPRR